MGERIKTVSFKKFKQIFLYLLIIGLNITILFFIIISACIGFEVKSQCQAAINSYEGDCVEALIAQLNDESNDPGTRNTTIWALGQIGDGRALGSLQNLYTGSIPPREPWDEVISQYELKKAIRLVEGGFNITAWLWRSSIDFSEYAVNEGNPETIILSDPSDRYYQLAQKIADGEQLVIADDIAEALTYRPKFILWVTSPGDISERDLWNIGDIFKRMDFYPALGIITGGVVEIAERLYENGKLAGDGKDYLASDVEVGQQVLEPILVDLNEPSKNTIPLTKDSLLQTLAEADYFYWVRHVSANKWMWNTTSPNYGEKDKLYSADIPELGPLVVHTPSCGSFQPWKSDSIAIGFINQGAAAYLGHVHSSVVSNSFLMRKGFKVPGRSTWEGFPLGILAQVRNRVEAKVASGTPLYFMLGDPRANLSDRQPYTILSDEVKYGIRTITGETGFQGYLALKVEGGAAYDFVTIPGLTAASENDFFFNNYLQTLDLGGDKYILFYQEENNFKVVLKREAPLLWTLYDGLLDALDYNWVTIGVVYNPFSLVLLIGLAILLSIKCRGGKRTLPNYKWFYLAGILFAGLHIAYVLLRMDKFTVSADMIDYSISQIVLGFIGFFSTSTAGLILVREAGKTISRVLGWLVAISPQLLLTGFKFGVISYTDFIFISQNTVHQPLWNYNSFWISFLVLVIELLLLIPLYRLAARKTAQQAETA